MSHDDFAIKSFAANLRLLCSYHPSISEVCRKLGINRQQFMRYVGEGAFPSRHNLRRICDFFGVDEFEILMPQDQFRAVVRLRPTGGGDDLTLPPMLPPFLTQAQRQKSILTKSLGHYFTYYFSFSVPEHILKALTTIYVWKQYTLYKRIERIRRPSAVGPPDVYKYAGMVSVVGDRLHMIDLETITGSELTHGILHMNYRNRVTVLTGLTTGVSGADAHEPSSSRLVMEYIGRSINLRQAIAECGVYKGKSAHIPDYVRDNLAAGGTINGPLRAAPL